MSINRVGALLPLFTFSLLVRFRDAMARHYRHVRKSVHANDLRITIEFVRDDLLFQSGSFIHPYLHRSFSLPYERLNGMVCGPNLLDMVELLKSSQPDEEDRFVIRDLDTLFQKPKVNDWKDKGV